MSDKLVIRGAREHNLKNVSLELPREKLIVFTGLSGSGKSSLAFDTIYAEGQRRYVESLSAYARQFLGQMDKPDVDFIEGLSPAISIDQKSASRNPRSTVGTITEVYDYLRLLYARIGVPHCPDVRGGGHPPDPPADRRPHPRSCPRAPGSRCWRRWCGAARASTRACSADLAGQGFARARVDGEMRELADREADQLARYEKHTIEVVVDRLVQPGGHRAPAHRLAGDRAAAGRGRGRGRARARGTARRARGRRSSRSASTWPARTTARRSTSWRPGTSRSTRPYGACPHCDGLGTRFEVDPELVVPNPDLTLDEGAIAPWAGARGEYFHRVVDGGGRDLRLPGRPRRGRS